MDGADVEERAVDADRVAGDAEAAHIVGAIVPALRVVVPGGWKSRVTHSWVPSGRLTLLTWTDRMLNPPQPLKLRLIRGGQPIGGPPVERGPLGISVKVPPCRSWAGPTAASR